MRDLVITLIGPDQPGIVDAVSEVVAANGGNWLDSRMAHLAGKFAGVLRVEVDEGSAAVLESALGALEARGLRVIVEQSEHADTPGHRAVEIDLLGLDRPGLVHEISALLLAHRINVEELTTDLPRAAHSGERVFHAHLLVIVPDDVRVSTLREELEKLATDLMVEIRLVEALGAGR